MKSRRPTRRLFPEVLEATFHDPKNCPIDPVAKLTLSDDPQTYGSALRLLRNMAEFKRETHERICLVDGSQPMTCIPAMSIRSRIWTVKERVIKLLFFAQLHSVTTVALSS